MNRFLHSFVVLVLLAVGGKPIVAQSKTLRIQSTQDMLRVHEDPKKFEGYTITISEKLAWIAAPGFNRHQETKGYIISWKCGEKLEGSELFGNPFGPQQKTLNYWCDTDTGVTARQTLRGLTYYRCGLTFRISKVSLNVFGQPVDHYFAVLTKITVPK